MKKIADCQNLENVEIIVRLSDVQIKKTQTNDDYASMIAYDGVEKIEAKMWKFTDELRSKLVNGEVYFVNGRMKDYQGKLQLNINDIRQINEIDDVDRSKFYDSACYSEKELRAFINDYLEKIDNAILKDVTSILLTKYYNKFYEYPAAVSMHHNYIGGLAYHTYCMLKLSDAFLDLYNFINKDLVYAGVILHDLGKLIELSGYKGTEYTKSGKLIGHIALGANEIYAASKDMGVCESEEIINLLHIILSHHGQLEYGSPKEPMTPEALLVHFLDLSDSKIAALELETLKTEVGEFTAPVLSMDRRIFYVPKLK